MKTLTPRQLARPAVAALALLAFGTASMCRADQTVQTATSLPTQVHVTVDTSGCDNSGEPAVTLGGSIRVSGFKSKLTLKKNRLSRRSTNFVSSCEAVLVPIGGKVAIPKQPSEDGTAGNPYIYLQIRDAQGAQLTEEYYLGRCVQGLTLDADVLSEVAAKCDVQIEGCSNRRGPDINIDCDLTISGMNATFIFRNNLKGTHTAEATADVAIVSEGTKIVVPKRRAKGGVGRNPLISLQFLHENDEPMCDPMTLGRCNKL